MILGRQTGAEIDDVPVAILSPLRSHHLKKPAIEARPARVGGENFQDLLGRDAIDFEVMMSAEHIVIDPADI